MKNQRSEWPRVSALLTLAFWIWGAGAASGQTRPGWRTFDSTYFSFPYPNGWTLENTNGRVAVSPSGNPPFFEIEYLTQYGGDIDRLIEAERNGLRALATQLAARVDFDDVEMGPRGGSEISAAISKPGIAPLITSILAVGVGRSIYVVRMLSTSAQNFEHLDSYRTPMLNGFNFKIPRSAITGAWDTEIPQGPISSQDRSSRNFNVTLSFQEDGAYVYSVIQSASPRWQLEVRGTYVAGAPTRNLNETVAVLNMIPGRVKFNPIDSSANQDYELSRLYHEGFPRIVAETLELQSQRQAHFYIRRSDRPAPQVILFPRQGSVPSGVQVLNSAGFTAGAVAPGSLVSLFGSFGGRDAAASSVPLPASLGGVTVRINGISAPLLYVGPQQINTQVPFDAGVGSASIAVTIGGNNLTGSVMIAPTAPGIFVKDGRAIAANQDYSTNSSANPAKVGSYITVYFSGQGAFRSPVATGAAAPQNPLAYTAAVTTATIGGRTAEVAYCGGAPGLAGVAQANIRIPAGLARGDVPLVIRIGNVSSNSATISATP